MVARLSAERHRIIHVYADPTGDGASHAKELIADWREGKARLDVTTDPAWSAVAAFLS
jgi:hypothetical protein